MTERRSSADLGAAAEAALSAFPFSDRDWEKDALAVEARLADTLQGSTESALLAAPLPSEPGEPTSLSATSTPLAQSGVRTQSLADMARRSVEQKQSAERAMARESLALAAQSRPSSEQAAVLREAVSAVRAIPAPLAPAVSGTPEVASAARASLAPPAAVTGPRSAAHSPWPKLGLVAGAVALAAAALLWLRAPTPTPTPLVSVLTAPAGAESKSESAASPPHAGVAVDHAAAIAVAPSAPLAVDPSSLAKEAATPAADAKRAKVPSAGSIAAAPIASAAPAGPTPEKFVLEDEQPSSAPAPTADKSDKPLPPDPALRPADSTGGAIPMKPSSGAVQAALGAVMSGARHCVAGDDAASSAVVVFAADGHVRSVTVAGPAAGKPSGACIEGQLSRARVQPFAAASFSINATVRPD